MEEINLRDYMVEEGVETVPVILLTGTTEEFERFCMITHRNRRNAIPVSAGFQIPFYPDLAIVHYGTYWLNGAYNSKEYKYRINELMEKTIK